MTDLTFFRTVVIVFSTVAVFVCAWPNALPQITNLFLGRPLSSNDKLYLLAVLFGSIIGLTPAVLAVVYAEELVSAFSDFFS